MVQITIDGRELEVAEGTSILRAALDNDIYIPHFCYHPHLSLSGNCRMCLVEIDGVPKLQISCGNQVREGMVVRTRNTSKRVYKAVKGQMEFLLTNHPLDCPICDQAGECPLQDQAWLVDQGKSRYRFGKRVWPRREIGGLLALEMDRCIHCLRCVRFCNEVAQAPEYETYWRGVHKDVNVQEGRPLSHKYTGNMADICPVGCLTLSNFRFAARVWDTADVNSICPLCSTGCNVTLSVKRDQVLRMRPRENPEVNGPWMCDTGRLAYRLLNEEERLEAPRMASPRGSGELYPISWANALSAVNETLQKTLTQAGPQGCAVVLSAFLSNEDAFMARRVLCEQAGIENVALWPSVDPAPDAADDLLLRADKAPNTEGLKALGLDRVPLARVAEQAGAGKIGFLLAIGYSYHARFVDEATAEALAKAGFMALQDVAVTPWSKGAEVLMPEPFFMERSGTFTNYAGRVQSFEQAVRGPRESLPAWRMLADLAQLAGYEAGGLDTLDKVQGALAETCPKLVV